MNGVAWTAEEDNLLIDLRAKGITAREISEKIGRTEESVRCRVKYLQLPKVAKRMPRPIQNYVRDREDDCPRVGQHLIEERDRRMLAPRDLTGIIMGDPPRGYSALERRA